MRFADAGKVGVALAMSAREEELRTDQALLPV